MFISCCFEIKRFARFWDNVDLSEFKSYIPIQLDGTCNGFQHLSLLCEEVELFEQLNLAESNKHDNPKDFYSFMLDKIQGYMFNRILQNDDISLTEKDHINRLNNLNFNRSHIKNLIMTKPYNATDFRLINNILETLEFRGVGILNTKTRELKLFPSKEELDMVNKESSDDDLTQDALLGELIPENIDINPKKKNKKTNIKNHDQEVKVVNLYSNHLKPDNFVTRENINYFVNTFNKILFNNYPHIKNLITYFKDIASIFNKFNLPII